MQEIDLGDDIQFKVKYKGAEYILREPTVQEIQSFQDKSDDPIEMISSFLSKLGLPVAIVPQMGMSKAKRLVDAMMEEVSKKK